MKYYNFYSGIKELQQRLAESEDYKDILNKYPWMGTNLVLLGLAGSHSYGVNTKDSDLDIKGVFIPPPDYTLGIMELDSINTSSIKSTKSGKDTVDITLVPIKKFCLDLAMGKDYAYELVNSDYARYLYSNTRYINCFKDSLSSAVSNSLIKRYLGNANGRILNIEKSLGETGVHNPGDLTMALKCLWIAKDILETGKAGIPFNSNRQIMYHISKGTDNLENILQDRDFDIHRYTQISIVDKLDYLYQLMGEVEELKSKLNLPEKGDVTIFNRLSVGVTLDFYNDLYFKDIVGIFEDKNI